MFVDGGAGDEPTGDHHRPVPLQHPDRPGHPRHLAGAGHLLALGRARDLQLHEERAR